MNDILRILQVVCMMGILTCSISCAQPEDREQESTSQDRIVLHDSAIVMPVEHLKAPPATGEAVTQQPVKILTTGTFHDDEVWEGVEQEDWFGLFNNSDGCYLRRTEVIARRVPDPMADNNDPTGWEIGVEEESKPMLLIAGPDYLAFRKIAPVEISKTELLPGDTLAFDYGGEQYALYAMGNKTAVQNEPQRYEITNYRLFLIVFNGEKPDQLLVEHESFDEAMVHVNFIGDIDGDNIPDLLINATRHYNVSLPVLYLSLPAGDKEILKEVGRHRSVGC